jgi:hypothetical protein
MADAFSANFNFTLPEVNASRDTWGGKLVANWSALDTLLFGRMPKAGGAFTGVVTFPAAFAPTMDGSPLVTQATLSARLPAGIIAMWSGLVAAIPAGWVLCDGTNGTPDLRQRFIMGAGTTAPGTVGGSLTPTVNVTAVSAGTPAGSIANAGSHNHGGSTQNYQLTISDLPNHSHGYEGLQTTGVQSGSGSTGAVTASRTTDSQGGGGSHAHGINSDGSHNHSFSGTVLAAHTHSVTIDDGRPPWYALAFIMKT